MVGQHCWLPSSHTPDGAQMSLTLYALYYSGLLWTQKCLEEQCTNLKLLFVTLIITVIMGLSLRIALGYQGQHGAYEDDISMFCILNIRYQFGCQMSSGYHANYVTF